MSVAVWSGALVAWERELAALKARIGPVFGRAEVRETAGAFLDGLLSGVARKTGWLLAEPGNPRHSPASDVAAGAPAIATFDVNLGAVKDKAVVLLVAVVHSANDAVSLTELPLHDLALASPHVAVRSVLVRS